MRSIFLIILIFTFFSVTPFNVVAADSDTSLEMLKRQIEQLQQQVLALEKAQQAQETEKAKQASLAKQVTKVEEAEPSTMPEKPLNNTLSVYATMRPTFGYFDEDAETFWDVRDALSRAGIKATNEFMPGWTAELHGEWGIDLSNNGDFGTARKAYVAVGGPYGRVAVGKQRPPQYLLIAEYVDIFNHANSPFSYDAEGIFFVNNMVTYRLQTGGFSWLAASQFDGDSGSNGADLVNLGLGYDQGGFHGAVTYLMQDNIDGNFTAGKDEVWAVSLAQDFNNGLYLAAAYQDKSYQRDTISQDRSGHTLDVSTAYRISEQFRVKLGYFDFDDGRGVLLSQRYDGYNTTLEWLPDDNLRFHLEYLTKDYDYLNDFDSWSIGFRYDFAKDWQF
ncbi:porin [Shewanella eurypsychrophilus]|uniref:Porin n=1 Tax=Shewanella eurypsychrophilus TaxID=2593656 RepID=A0ABX6V3B5_9GAMM|nr:MULTISPECIES: porin [Shewanella]QFU21845.1 porin [Shewanella sp. YLB-09]QPG57134.1 porin [Shewanella eurypsychrophilus]